MVMAMVKIKVVTLNPTMTYFINLFARARVHKHTHLVGHVVLSNDHQAVI